MIPEGGIYQIWKPQWWRYCVVNRMVMTSVPSSISDTLLNFGINVLPLWVPVCSPEQVNTAHRRAGCCSRNTTVRNPTS